MKQLLPVIDLIHINRIPIFHHHHHLLLPLLFPKYSVEPQKKKMLSLGIYFNSACHCIHQQPNPLSNGYYFVFNWNLSVFRLFITFSCAIIFFCRCACSKICMLCSCINILYSIEQKSHCIQRNR